ncbi:ATP-binding protein [Alkalinema pantanalense CENA528]|uniref:ATP-binding protein n=1 Tax=Alkalinema pantanalense TaxID=1620705 RepID=UPI003D6EF6D8
MLSITSAEFNSCQAVIRSPFTIAPTASVMDALHLMSAEQSSCLLPTDAEPPDTSYLATLAEAKGSCVLVVAEAQLLGILTERDVVRLSAENRDLAAVAIAEVMSRPVRVLQRSELQDLFVPLNLFRQHQIRHLVVVEEDGSIFGLLTHETIQQWLQPVDLLRIRLVSEMMTKNVISESADVSVLRLTQLMAQKCVSYIIIVEPSLSPQNQSSSNHYPTTPATTNALENNLVQTNLSSALRPIGIVTERDIVQLQTLQLPLDRISAREVMSHPVLAVSPEDSLLIAHQMMQTHRVSRVIVSNPQGNLAGILTRTSLLNLLNPIELYQVLEILQTKVIQLEQEKMTGSGENSALLGDEPNISPTSYEARLNALHLGGLSKDITHRKLADSALQDGEQRYASLAATAPVSIFRTDSEGNCIYVNDRWCETAGLSLEAALGNGWIAALYPDDQDRVLEAWQQSIHHAHPFQLQYRLQRPDRRITWVYGQAVAERNSTGEVIGYVGSLTDISDRKQAEQELQRQVELNQIITNFSNSFINATLEEIPREIQSALNVLAELQQIDLIYVMNFSDLSQPVTVLYQWISTDLISIIPAFQNLSSLHHPLSNFPWSQAQLKDGNFVNLPSLDALPPEALTDRESWQRLGVKSLLAFPLSWSGELTGWLCFLNCSREHCYPAPEIIVLEQFSVAISHALQRQRSEQLLQDYNQRLEQQVAERTEALRRSEAQLQALNQELIRSNKELENFAYIASHDLREPLRAIVSYTQLLQEAAQTHPLNDSMLECLHYIHDGGQRMQQLIQDLLSYARLSYQEQEREPVSCQEVIEQVLSYLRVTIADNQATIIVDPLPTLHANRTQMLQLLQNLVDNAIKFRQSEPPRISIRATPLPSQGWQFTVQDNGIGMKPEYLDRIFDIFRRLHPRTKFPGTGIGLAICKKIVELYGGKIWAESELGSGTTIHFTIPN